MKKKSIYTKKIIENMHLYRLNHEICKNMQNKI